VSGRRLSPWAITYTGWAPEEQPLREALTTLGNGRMATRGAVEEAEAGGPHYPGTYLAGGYNRATSEVAGKLIENEDLANWPNWLGLNFRHEGGHWFDLSAVEIHDYECTLDLHAGVLDRRVDFTDRDGRTSRLESRRIVHMHDPNLAAIEWALTPIDWCGTIEVYAGLDGRVQNAGVSRYRGLEAEHLEVLGAGATGEDGVFLVCRTRQSHIVMAQAARTRVRINGDPAAVQRRIELGAKQVGHVLTVACEAKRALRVEKIVTLFSSRDRAISEPYDAACKHVHRQGEFASLLASHELAWERLWHRADLRLVSPDPRPQTVLRLHVFHLLQTASLHTIDGDAGVPARGLHGEAYRGHVFWDELFIFPYLNLRIPELTRALLMYRYHRLPEARSAAQAAGYRGAMFPWQSGSDGREESQVVHLNPKSGRWIPDHTYRQRHVNAAVAYNVWQHYQATGDLEFLSDRGAEVLLEVAQFWASIARYDDARERYSICGVVGPDEFHTGYPGRAQPGLDNNAYTNVMAAWVLKTARTALDALAEQRRRELLAQLDISPGDLLRWETVRRGMVVAWHGDGDGDGDPIISQFEGWDALEELDWDGLRARYGDLARLDRLLEAQGDDPNRYKAGKQADVLMLFFLFSSEELSSLFADMGYQFKGDWIPRNIQYYLARTSHGSTLSRVVHAWVLARLDRPRSWHLFCDALASDIDDSQGGTTAEGIHLGAMAGTVDLVQRCYTGIEMRDEVLFFNPCLPLELERLELALRYRGHRLGVEITHAQLRVWFEEGRLAPALIGFAGEVHEMAAGCERQFPLASACADPADPAGTKQEDT
jgi:trehalose/maltose hydrolase-like predicted phosphorylase